ncbi:MAG: hypothetical protein HWN68_06360 [Desulfobacterales bacterium]|nr:hypothetical protein [Desulfobacterales bacterium]
MTDKNKEPIDLLKRRTGKLLEQERRKEEAERGRKQLEWSGAKFAAEAEAIDLSEEVLKGVKTFMCTIADRVKEARSINEVERSCFGLVLLLLRDYDRVAFDKLLKMMKDEEGI